MPGRGDDARAVRALAHPLRLRLLELLDHAGTLTATQASEILGESPANCAFHLRTLGKYGFAEEAGGGRGRERPWRRAQEIIRVESREDDPEYPAAASDLGQILLPDLLQRALATIARHDQWPADWQHGVLHQDAMPLYLTPGEARELQAGMSALTTRYLDRTANPQARPPGAIPVQFLMLAHPLLHLLGITPGSAGDDERDSRP